LYHPPSIPVEQLPNAFYATHNEFFDAQALTLNALLSTLPSKTEHMFNIKAKVYDTISFASLLLGAHVLTLLSFLETICKA